MITPDRLTFLPTPGLELGVAERYPGPGLHVVLGRNNSGKTRLLKAVEGARLSGVLSNLKEQRGTPRQDHAGLREMWALVTDIGLTWNRYLPPMTPGQSPPPQIVTLGPFPSPLPPNLPPSDSPTWTALTAEVYDLLKARPARLVGTNRLFPQTGALGSSAPIDSLPNRAAFLEGLSRAPDDKQTEQHREIAESFFQITDVRLAHRGNAAETTVFIVEPGSERRPLDDCGDGLRDVVSIVTEAIVHPEHDLLIDEPGLRLHPHGQRLMLRFLEEQAKSRAIWITSHDGVFASSTSAVARVSVRRDLDHVSRVVSLFDQDDARAALLELGWEPGDAFLADHVLLCEGPADDIAFRFALRSLVAQDSAWSGVVVSMLGGQGKALADDPLELEERLKLVEGIAPHARHVVLLDSDSRDDTAKSLLQAKLARKRFQLRFHEHSDIESFWLLSARLTKVILAELFARRALPEPENLAAHVETALSGRPAGTKGSDVFDKLCSDFQLRQGDKRLIAEIAVENAAAVAPEVVAALQNALKRALEPSGPPAT